jgi:hypothetical protein
MKLHANTLLNSLYFPLSFIYIYMCIAPGGQEPTELPHNGIDVSHQNTIEVEVITDDLDSVDEVIVDDLDSVDEHRETVVPAARTSQQRWGGATVVTVDPDNEDEAPEEWADGVVVDQVHRASVSEKLQDEDKFAEIWYERWFFKAFPQLKRGRGVCVYVWRECYASSPGPISNFTNGE